MYFSGAMVFRVFESPLISLAISRGVEDIPRQPSARTRLSICVVKPVSNPITLAIHQVQLATKKY